MSTDTAVITMVSGAMLVGGVCLTVDLQRDLARCGEPDWPLDARWINDFEYREYMSRIGVTLAPAHERIVAGERPVWRFVVERIGTRFGTSAASPMSEHEQRRVETVLAARLAA